MNKNTGLRKALRYARALVARKSHELSTLNRGLEEIVRERTRELEIATNQAIAANQAKSQFLANMSHEIRTPLNGLLGFVHLLEKTPLNGVQQEYLATVVKSGDLLLNIINDVLEFSKVEAGKIQLDLRPFHLKRCVEAIVEVMANQVYEKGLELPVYIDEQIPKQLIGDEGRIRQVILNLVGNAIKFTPTGEVAVRVESLGCVNDGTFSIRFEVSDSGVGIPASKIQSIFSAFEQADPSDTRRYGGTGLGLTIAQEMVKAMGGEIKVTSEETKGSKFSFVLKMATPGNGEMEFSERDFSFREAAAIFVSNQTIRTNLENRLKSWNVPFCSVQTWQEIDFEFAKGKAKNFIVDHVFASSQMGHDKIQALQASQVHVIVMTSPKEKISHLAYYVDLGVDVLVKPVKREDLFRSIETKRVASVAEKVAPVQAPKTAVKNAKILLVEDNVINQQLAIAMLESEGYHADVAFDGSEAVWRCENETYDLVLMDCQMPVMDGMEATRRIRTKNKQVKIVAMTANAFKKTKEQCFDAGMDDFITKPVTEEELARVISTNLLRQNTG